MSQPAPTVSARLNEMLAAAGLDPLNHATAQQFSNYFGLLLRWNARMNLTAIRNDEGILSRHFVESIACARALPAGIATLLDFGSGAGFPGIPIALCRPEIAVTLAESQGKKAAFLCEAARVLGISVQVHSGRAELLQARFDCITLRAVDSMAEAVQAAGTLLNSSGTIAIMTSQGELEPLRTLLGGAFHWPTPIRLPGSDRRVLVLAKLKSG